MSVKIFPRSQAYRDGWDRIFNKEKQNESFRGHIKQKGEKNKEKQSD